MEVLPSCRSGFDLTKGRAFLEVLASWWTDLRTALLKFKKCFEPLIFWLTLKLSRIPGGSWCPHLWPASPVDIDADGTVGAAAAHEEVGAVVGLHHPDEIPAAVLEKRGRERETIRGQRSGRDSGGHPRAASWLPRHPVP